MSGHLITSLWSVSNTLISFCASFGILAVAVLQVFKNFHGFGRALSSFEAMHCSERAYMLQRSRERYSTIVVDLVRIGPDRRDSDAVKWTAVALVSYPSSQVPLGTTHSASGQYLPGSSPGTYPNLSVASKSQPEMVSFFSSLSTSPTITQSAK